MGQKLVLYNESWKMTRETVTDDGDSVSSDYAVLATTLNLGSLPLVIFSDNWESSCSVFSYVNFNVKAYLWNGSMFYYSELMTNPIKRPRHKPYMASFSIHQLRLVQ